MTNLVSLVHGHLPHAVEIIVGFLSLVSAIINPLLYGKMSLRYRRGYQFILRKILSICGGEKPDGRLFDDKRKGSQATYSTFSQRALKRESVALAVEVHPHTNRAFEDDEKKHNYPNKPTQSNPAFDTSKDDDDDDTGITIYPVEINKKRDEINDDDDEQNETQISICPLNESVQFNGSDGGTKNSDSNAEDAESAEKATTVDEEDFSIYPYDESIVAHFEDLKKLVEDDNASNNTLHSSTDSKKVLEDGNSKGNETLNSQEINKDEDINIPGTVLGGIGLDDAVEDCNHCTSSIDFNFTSSMDDEKESESQTGQTGSEIHSVNEQFSQEDSDASDSFGEGSILGNYDVAENWTRERKDEPDKEEESSESSSKGSGDVNYDIMDLLEKKNKPVQLVTNGHFFVDDIVKRMEEERQKRHSMESYDLLSDNLSVREGQLDDNDNPSEVATETSEKNEQEVIEENQTSSENNEGNEKDEMEKESNGDKMGEIEHKQEDERVKDGIEKRRNGNEMEEKEHKQEDERVRIIDEEKEERKKEKDQPSIDNKDTSVEKEQEREEEKGNENCQNEKGQKEENEKKNEEEPALESDQNETDFAAYGSIFKGAKSEVSGRRNYTRTMSDLLRRELGEV
ncbi:hypothetical protein QZH41_017829 [Actinostola sp. cb2023]|nr:hypothetical protein QZH41_017829 [Actinostola sp. cb2023]